MDDGDEGIAIYRFLLPYHTHKDTHTRTHKEDQCHLWSLQSLFYSTADLMSCCFREPQTRLSLLFIYVQSCYLICKLNDCLSKRSTLLNISFECCFLFSLHINVFQLKNSTLKSSLTRQTWWNLSNISKRVTGRSVCLPRLCWCFCFAPVGVYFLL